MRIGAARLCICAIASAACIADAKERCIQSPDHFETGIAYHLSKNGIPFRVAAEGGTCVGEGDSAALDAAMRQVEKFFWELAYPILDECEERAFVDWATKENLRFDVGHVVDLGKKAAGRLFPR